MTGPRRLSQTISEGDGISLIVPVDDLDAARAAEDAGAEGLLLTQEVEGVREATGLPIVWWGPESAAGLADGCVLDATGFDDEDDELERRFAGLDEQGLECIVEVRDADTIEAALERLDPEIFLLSPRGSEEAADAVERVLDLLEDVPAGKLAIAHLRVPTKDEVAELERAGVDAVIVGTSNVSDLVGAPPPEV